MGCRLTRTKVSDLQDGGGGGGDLVCKHTHTHALDDGQALKGFCVCEKVFWVCPRCCVCCHGAAAQT